jgi:hemerythrin-like domain-containing protein
MRGFVNGGRILATGGPMTATTALRSEHEIILAVIACLRAACDAARGGEDFDPESFRKGVDFIRAYADGWHHAKEEAHLFPALEAAGMPRESGPVGVMLHEHEIGRAHVGMMADHLDAAAEGDRPAQATVVEHALAYADLLEAHIQKEDGILFNMADQLLPPPEHQRLEEAYLTAIPDGADATTGAHYEKLARELCERWRIDPDKVRSVPESGGCHGF